MGGVTEDQVEYGCVSCCVSPVASSCCAGFVFDGFVRHRFSGLSKASPRRRASCHAHHAGHHRHLHIIVMPLPARRVAGCGGCCRGASNFASSCPRRHGQLQRFGPPNMAPKCAVPGASRAPRAGSAAWRGCRRAALPTPRPVSHPTPAPAATATTGSSAHRYRRRGAPLHRRQSDRPRPAVVRAVHEHGLKRSGHRGTGSDMARSFAGYGQRVPARRSAPSPSWRGRGGGHVGVVSGIDAQAIRSWCPAIMATGSGKRRSRAAGSTLRDADESRRTRRNAARPCSRTARLFHRDRVDRRQSVPPVESPRHRCRNRCGRAGASAPAGCGGRAPRCRDRR